MSFTMHFCLWWSSHISARAMQHSQFQQVHKNCIKSINLANELKLFNYIAFFFPSPMLMNDFRNGLVLSILCVLKVNTQRFFSLQFIINCSGIEIIIKYVFIDHVFSHHKNHHHSLLNCVATKTNRWEQLNAEKRALSNCIKSKENK